MSDLETLGANVDIRSGTGQGRRKRIAAVTLRMHRTRGCWVGPDADHLVEMKFRTSENWGEATALFSGDKDIAIPSAWNRTGRIFVRQTDPLPFTVLAAIPKVDRGEMS